MASRYNKKGLRKKFPTKQAFYHIRFLVVKAVDEVLDDVGLVPAAVVAVLGGNVLGLVEVPDPQQDGHQTQHCFGSPVPVSGFLYMKVVEVRVWNTFTPGLNHMKKTRTCLHKNLGIQVKSL